jgi:8-oxo-dGTP diphosphatase
MRDVTLVLPIREERVLLGLKKRGFGVGKVNGFGGKLNEGESILEAAVRELFEEVGITTNVDSLNKVAELSFRFPHKEGGDWDQLVHVFFIEEWGGEPKETEEMAFEWHDLNQLPFDRMWDDDRYWFPEVLKGRKIKGDFTFSEDNKTIDAQKIIDLS